MDDVEESSCVPVKDGSKLVKLENGSVKLPPVTVLNKSLALVNGFKSDEVPLLEEDPPLSNELTELIGSVNALVKPELPLVNDERGLVRLDNPLDELVNASSGELNALVKLDKSGNCIVCCVNAVGSFSKVA